LALPLISIIIPTYNQEDYIESAIESAIIQGYENKEIIVLDDCSTDLTHEKASEYRRHTGVRVFRNANNLGVPENWNKAISLSQGSFIKPLFGDDLLLPGCLEQLYRAIEGKEDAGFVTIVYQDEVFRSRDTLSRGELASLVFPCMMNIIGEPTTLLIRKEVFDTVGLFDDQFAQLVDLEFYVRVSRKYEIKAVPHILCSFRVHPGQLSNENLKQAVHLRDYALLRERYMREKKFWPFRLKVFIYQTIFQNETVFMKLLNKYVTSYLLQMYRYIRKKKSALFKDFPAEYAKYFETFA
jgi:glycosyltransferase involved in cell wall biosynthesis